MVFVTQINAMIDFLEKHPEMIGSRNTKEGRMRNKKYWTACARILNSVSPDCPTKTPDEWRMYYNEYKCKTMKRMRTIQYLSTGVQRKSLNMTSCQRRLCKLLTSISQKEQSKLNKSLDEHQTSEQETNGQSVGENSDHITFDEDSGDIPLHRVKDESRLTGFDDTDTRDSDILDGSRAGGRSVERAEELHRLAVAERIWALKTLRERHHAARLERELMQLRRDRAQLELERARRQQGYDTS